MATSWQHATSSKVASSKFSFFYEYNSISKPFPSSKYPLALFDQLQHTHPQPKLIGYDIGCSFKHTAEKGVEDLCGQFVVPSMHGYAHNRACQLSHHPKYVDGAGIEDFETCERFFSISNNCAGITRHATPFHRHQLLDTHFRDHDESLRMNLGKFIYTKYKEAGERISKITEMFQTLKMEDSVKDGTFDRYLREEASHLLLPDLEPLEDQARFNYITVLEKYWKASSNWEHLASKSGVGCGQITPPTVPLSAELKRALTLYNEASAEAEHFERILGITERWQLDSTEYKEAKKWSNERHYRLALDHLERLVIQRIFELQKANLVSTGECHYISG
jgi:hypothetical protein